MSEWSVYLLRCADNSIYTGIATDVERRLGEHAGSARGAKYLSGRGPFHLLCACPVGDRSLASRVEYRLKRLPKREKERLVASPDRFESHVRAIMGAA